MRITNAFLLGFFWIAVSVRPYILTFAAYQQITLLPDERRPQAHHAPDLPARVEHAAADSVAHLHAVAHNAQQSARPLLHVFQSIGRWLGTVLAALIGLYLAWQGLSGLLFR
ncbi:MAG: hypothetical protein R2838_24565 [Caldilineaceae bacterium]